MYYLELLRMTGFLMSTRRDNTSKLSGLGNLLAGIASLLVITIPLPLEPWSLRNIEKPAGKILLSEMELQMHDSVTQAQKIEIEFIN